MNRGHRNPGISLGAAIVLLTINASLCAQPKTGFNINESGFFDGTNKAYTIESGCVTVDLDERVVLCPTGLGHLASGREPVKEIKFLFRSAISHDCWFHISWSPGGSGREQFDVLHNSVEVGKSALIDAQYKPNRFVAEKFRIRLNEGDNDITLRHLSGDGLHFKCVLLSASDVPPGVPPLNPTLKFPTLKAYESECRERGIMLDRGNVRLFAPKRRAGEAKVIFEYLVRAYDELYRLAGIHPEYKIVVYHFPEGNEHGWGGTSNCAIWYSYKNLDLNSQEEWTRHKVPHVSGYIEEMAHNFGGRAGAQFGWEMIGWNLGVKVTKLVANNPVFTEHVQRTRAVQRETFNRYEKAGFVFPQDLPANLCDRVHAHILWMCERQYGPDFWQDFFKEIRKEHENLMAAEYLADADKIRNRKYEITVECFDRLPGIEFKKTLQKYQISLDTAIKSLRPIEPGWDRKFVPKPVRSEDG